MATTELNQFGESGIDLIVRCLSLGPELMDIFENALGNIAVDRVIFFPICCSC